MTVTMTMYLWWSLCTLYLHMCQVRVALTHFAPDHPSPLILFSYCATPDCLVAASNHIFHDKKRNKKILHSGNPAYANRIGILARLVALFSLLCTTSSDILCLSSVEFEKRCELSKLQDGQMIAAQK